RKGTLLALDLPLGVEWILGGLYVAIAAVGAFIFYFAGSEASTGKAVLAAQEVIAKGMSTYEQGRADAAEDEQEPDDGTWKPQVDHDIRERMLRLQGRLVVYSLVVSTLCTALLLCFLHDRAAGVLTPTRCETTA